MRGLQRNTTRSHRWSQKSGRQWHKRRPWTVWRTTSFSAEMTESHLCVTHTMHSVLVLSLLAFEMYYFSSFFCVLDRLKFARHWTATWVGGGGVSENLLNQPARQHVFFKFLKKTLVSLTKKDVWMTFVIFFISLVFSLNLKKENCHYAFLSSSFLSPF